MTRTCPLCEAMCGLQLTIDDDDTVRRVRGDRLDQYSRGFICPKGASLGHIEADPGRLQRPLVRRDGVLQEASWDEAFAEVDRLIGRVVDAHGRDAVAVFLGNAMTHNVGSVLYQPTLMRSLSTRNVYSPATLDNMPHSLTAAWMFGNAGTIPVPDLDRTNLLVIVGANPVVSNGSVGAVPDYRGKLRSIRDRGGAVVVVDPTRTATAAEADLHIRVRPGADAFLLAGVLHTMFADDLIRPRVLAVAVNGIDDLRAAMQPFSPERVADRCGVEASTIRQLAATIASAQTAAVYCRLGTTLNRFGTITSWLVSALNVLSGHIGSVGGMMFPESAAGSPTTRPHRAAPETTIGRYHSRVRGAPEVLGEFPASCLAEEILVEGPGRVRALLTVGGNPARSIPNSAAVEEALASLDALICVDIYLNETARFAHVVLPPAGMLTRPHFDVVLTNYTIRNVARFSPALLPVPAHSMEEWRILLRLSAIFAGQGPDEDVDAIAADLVDKLIVSVHRESGVPIDEISAAVRDVGPEALIDLRLRSGPYGDLFGRRPGGLTLDVLRSNPHGIDLGALRPRLAEVVRTQSGAIELAPPPLLGDIHRLVDALHDDIPELQLIGRRHARSKNSWLHNIPVLVKGQDRCTLQMHPHDAAARNIVDRDQVTVSTTVGQVTVAAEVTDAMTQGVCSLPHGWGHDVSGTGREVATRLAGANSNLLADDHDLDPLSGTAALNGFAVTVTLSGQIPTATHTIEPASSADALVAIGE